jgi:hypothetical protein
MHSRILCHNNHDVDIVLVWPPNFFEGSVASQLLVNKQPSCAPAPPGHLPSAGHASSSHRRSCLAIQPMARPNQWTFLLLSPLAHWHIESLQPGPRGRQHRHSSMIRQRPRLVVEIFGRKILVTFFVVIWQNLSNRGLTKLKRFVSIFMDKLCN